MDFTMSMPTFLIIVSLILLTLEVAVFGFGTLFLVFIAAGCASTAGLMYLGVIGDGYLTAALATGILSLLAGFALWKPLRKLQSSHQSPDNQPNVFADVRFILADDISRDNSSKHQYSGIEWNVVPADGNDEIKAGTEVAVVKTSVGKFHVQAIAATTNVE